MLLLAEKTWRVGCGVRLRVTVDVVEMYDLTGDGDLCVVVDSLTVLLLL